MVDRAISIPGPLLVPKEHGAWAMLLIPFVSALVLARELTWEVAPAAVAVLGVFVVREPLVVLWRGFGPTAAAWRSLAWYGPAILLSGLVLLWRLPAAPLVALGGFAGVMLAASTCLVARNRRRSVLLQTLSAAGLNASALVAWLAVRPRIEPPVLWLWGLQFAHSFAALLAVHARLEARIAARTSAERAEARRRAGIAQALLFAAALALAAAGRWGLAAAVAFSGAVHAADLRRLRRPAFVQTPLTHVGVREVAISAAFSAMLLVGLA